jgi:hypothetical protein
MNKPRPLTQLELCGGGLPHWSNRYAEWMSQLSSFSTGTERARMGRIRAIRALNNTVKKMLMGWDPSQCDQVVTDIRDMAKLMARADAAKRGEEYAI